MTSALAGVKARPRCLESAVLALALAACAQGTTLDTLQAGSSNGDGGGRGDGGNSGDGGSRAGNGGSRAGDGGSQSTPSSSEATSVTSSNGVTSVTSTAQSSSATTSGVTTAAVTTAAATTSSTGGGPVDCDPLDPAPLCGGGAHCFPAADGVTGCGEAGTGQDYDSCEAHSDCAPIAVCINFGRPVCCQRLCIDDFDCPGFFELCYPFDPQIYDAFGTEYGFCNDGFFDCIG